MGSYFTLTLAQEAGSKTKTKNTSAKKSLTHPKRLNFGFILAAFVVMLAVGYLVQVNSLSTKGYEIRQLELEVQKLKDQSRRLELEASALQSIQNLEEDAKTLNLTPSGTVKHLPGRDYAFND